jgi:hypothetical protein
LVTLLAFAALLLHSWCWNASIGAEGYRLYWSEWQGEFHEYQMVETTQVCVPVGTIPDPLPGEIYYIVVTAYNSAGESTTEHGDIWP